MDRRCSSALIAILLSLPLAACGSGQAPLPSGSPGTASAPTTERPPQPTPTRPSPATPQPTPLTLLPARPADALDEPTAARLQSALEEVVRIGAPDAIGAVITPDGSWAGASGIDGPGGHHAAPDDEFGIASVSKLFLGALVVRLAEQGKLELDAPIATYLAGDDVDSNGATVRQALSMRSGIGNTSPGVIEQALAACGDPWTRKEMLATVPAPFAPAGTKYEYSNPTYKLVSYAAESAAGMPLADAFRRLVLDPVGADRILLQAQGTPTPKPWALPIKPAGVFDIADAGAGDSLPCFGFSSLQFGAAGMAADAPSLASWGWDLFAGRVVGAEALRSMLPEGRNDYGLGLERFHDFSPNLVYGHSGSQPGYAAILAVLPVRQTVVVCFINAEGADVAAGARALLRALDG